MPLIHIEWFAGRTVEQKRELVVVLTHDVCRVTGCSPDSVEIIFHDISKDDWAQGGAIIADVDVSP